MSQEIDTLSISDLALDAGVLAPYVFGERKIQPATVSLSLGLDQGFSSAASSDALDQNTVHYGNLAKAVRDKRPQGQTLEDVLNWTESAVDRLARREDGTSRVGKSVVTLWLPKASMGGEGVKVTSVREGRQKTRTVDWGFEGVKIMTLIGVNSIERTARQPLEVDVEFCTIGEEVLKQDVQAFGLEREIVEIIEATTFETLESLGEHVVKHLTPKIKEALPSCYWMSLTMRKPKAIAFADAPTLTITRTLHSAPRSVDRSKDAAMGNGSKLNLIKPYV